MGVYGSTYGHPETGVYLLVYAGSAIAPFTGQPDDGWSAQDHFPTTWRAKSTPTTFRATDAPNTWRSK